jgi:hypothetical protein
MAIVTVEMKMIERMNASKYHLFTKECNEFLKGLSGSNIKREVP